MSTEEGDAVAASTDLLSVTSGAAGGGGGGVLTVVVAEPLLLSVRVSVVVVVAEAVLTSAPVTPALTRAVSVKVADSPAGDAPVRVKRTLCPDVVAVQLAGCASERNVTPAGSASVTTTSEAAPAPALAYESV